MADALTDPKLLDAVVDRDIAVVTLRVDRLDRHNDRQFLRGFAVLAESQRVVLDLAALNFVDLQGIAALLRAITLVCALHGELKLCRVQGDVRRLLVRMQLHRSVEIYHSRDQAISAFHL